MPDKVTVPILMVRLEKEAKQRIEVVLTAMTGKLVKQIGKEQVRIAFDLAAHAVVAAIQKSITTLGFVRSGTLLDSVRLDGPASESMAIVGFLGQHDKQRTNAQVAWYLNEEYGLVEYAEYEQPAKIAWRLAINGR